MDCNPQNGKKNDGFLFLYFLLSFYIIHLGWLFKVDGFVRKKNPKEITKK